MLYSAFQALGTAMSGYDSLQALKKHRPMARGQAELREAELREAELSCGNWVRLPTASERGFQQMLLKL